MPKAPAWILVIEAAKEWGIPPYKIGGGSKTLWFARFQAVRESEGKRAAKMENERKLARMQKRGKHK